MGKFIDLTGMQFGELKVIGKVDTDKLGAWWLCECSCGNTKIISTSHLNAGMDSCGHIEDLTGIVFGRLTAIEYVGKNKNGVILWKCECSCGKTKTVEAPSLKRGLTNSCGCLHNEIIAQIGKYNLIDLVGQRFGRLIVIERAESPEGLSKKQTYWLCECDCGERGIVHGGSLINGETQSCGCLHKERTSNARLIDLVGQRIGKLVVIERANDYVFDDGTKNVRWLCQCDCGNTTIVLSSSLLNEHTRSCGCINESLIATELKEYFTINYNATVEYPALKNPKTNVALRFDIYVPNGIYIEIHGQQHYKFIKGWHVTLDGFKDSQYRDRIKKEYAEKNGLFIEIDLRKIKTTDDAIGYIEDIFSKL